jgi:23S rRNA (cytidine1920-2'-O)/16S rRNA (cytidine1409-2'-O)-methyltransferase
MKRAKSMRLDELLVTRELVTDAKSARGWILAGKVIVDGERQDKAGHPVRVDADIQMKGMGQYVGRGGTKLDGALTDLGIDVSGKVVLDCGASTGGFTDCLLQRGATKVYAVDVGHGTLAGRLRADERVDNLERTNIGDLAPGQFTPSPSLATVDVTYLSLRKAIPIVAPLLGAKGEILCLVKPLFEVSNAAARRSGELGDDPTTYERVLHDLAGFVQSLDMAATGVTHSRITGTRGTLEFFLRACLDPAACGSSIRTERIEAVVASAMHLAD